MGFHRERDTVKHLCSQLVHVTYNIAHGWIDKNSVNLLLKMRKQKYIWMERDKMRKGESFWRDTSCSMYTEKIVNRWTLSELKGNMLLYWSGEPRNSEAEHWSHGAKFLAGVSWDVFCVLYFISDGYLCCWLLRQNRAAKGKITIGVRIEKCKIVWTLRQETDFCSDTFDLSYQNTWEQVHFYSQLWLANY